MMGPSTLIALEIAGGKAGAFRFLNAIELFRISNNLGDSKSLAVHPANHHAPALHAGGLGLMGVGEGLVRLSFGLEHPDDLIADLEQALALV